MVNSTYLRILPLGYFTRLTAYSQVDDFKGYSYPLLPSTLSFFHSSNNGEPWGNFVDVKVNAPQILAYEVKRKRVGRVFISSVCDGWQPREASYHLTRQCLEILLHYRYPLTFLTKSTLASRDLDLLVSKEGVEFGVTKTEPLDKSCRQILRFTKVKMPEVVGYRVKASPLHRLRHVCAK